MTKPKKRLSGHAALKLGDRHSMHIGIPLADYAEIAQAAKSEGRPVSNFVVHHSTEAAKKKNLEK